MRIRSWAAVLAVLGLSGCLSMNSVNHRTSGAPESEWTPPARAEAPPSGLPVTKIPPGLLETRGAWTLGNLVDIGLSNNPRTWAAWNNARSAAAVVGAAAGAYLPLVDVTVDASKAKAAFAGGQFVIKQTTLVPEANLSLLIFDFGGREAAIQAARRILEAANWAHNSVIQDVILEIESAYYQYIAARALLRVQEASLESARVNHAAARDRHDAGVATIADVLQAKTALSSAELEVVTSRGLILTLHGQLAVAMGLQAATEFEIADELPDEPPAEAVGEEIDAYLREAQAERPELASARALVLVAQADIRRARAGFFPSVSADANYGRVYYRDRAVSNTNYSFGLTLDLPVFSGLRREYEYLRAKLAEESAKDRLSELERQVDLEVWTSYYGVKTAEQRLKTAGDLLTSAEASYDVALGRYREGVGSILDLLAAQTRLESGRVQVVQAKADWFLALVQFTHDTGTLGRPGADLRPGASPAAKEGDPRP